MILLPKDPRHDVLIAALYALVVFAAKSAARRLQ